MTEKMKNKLANLKASQAAGEHLPCPRCGRNTMKPEIATNALSRHADGVFICSDCGVREALLDVMNQKLPLIQWAYFGPRRPDNPFKDLDAKDAARIIEHEQIGALKEIFCLCQEDSENGMEYRAQAFERCPGLAELWMQPFMAMFETKTEPVAVRFKEMDGQCMYSIDILG